MFLSSLPSSSLHSQIAMYIFALHDPFLLEHLSALDERKSPCQLSSTMESQLQGLVFPSCLAGEMNFQLDCSAPILHSSSLRRMKSESCLWKPPTHKKYVYSIVLGTTQLMYICYRDEKQIQCEVGWLWVVAFILDASACHASWLEFLFDIWFH